MEDNDGDLEFNPAERIIRLTGEISEETSEKFIQNLHSVAETPGEIVVIIHSDGGGLEDGFRIIDAMSVAKIKGCPIHTVVAGKAYSMGAYIACCGDRRTAYEHARIMFHSGRYDGSDGTLTKKELKQMYGEMMAFDIMLSNILRSVGVKEDMIDRMMSSDVYMGPDEAKALGIIQDIEREVI